MLSTNNILKPSDGRPVAMPSQDMIIGLFHLTSNPDPSVPVEKDEDGNPVVPYFSSQAEAQMAFDAGNLDLNATARIRFADGTVPPEGWEAPEGWESGDELILETSLGRAIFNELLPTDYPFVNEVVGKKQLGNIVNTLTQRYPNVLVADCLDALKSAGFHWSRGRASRLRSPTFRPRRVSARSWPATRPRPPRSVEQFETGIILEETRTRSSSSCGCSAPKRSPRICARTSPSATPCTAW